MRRLFVIWRKKALNEHRLAIEHRLAYAAKQYPTRIIMSLLAGKHKRLLNYSWKLLRETADE